MQWFSGSWLLRRIAVAQVQLPIQRWEREHYLPFRPSELLRLLRDHDAEKKVDHEHLEHKTEELKRSIRLQYQSHHEYLTDLYARFDPDRDLSEREFELHDFSDSLSPQVDEVACRCLFAEIADTLSHANYRRLTPSEIQSAIGAASHWGVKLRIRFSSFRRLEVYGRGDIMTKRIRREWWNFFRTRELDVPIYQRLVVVFRPKELQSLPDPLDPNRVHIRMFKNVPKEDIDMMLPGTQVRLSWLDTGKIGIPTLWGIVMMTSKVAKTLGVVALLGALKIVSWFLLLIAAIVATLFYGIKSFFSYTTTKSRYQLNVTRKLYYQNLDNNLGALLRLEEEAELQEVCESLIAYFILLRESRALSREEIDTEAESLLKLLTDFPIDFDVDDALRDLVSMGAVQFNEQGWLPA